MEKLYLFGIVLILCLVLPWLFRKAAKHIKTPPPPWMSQEEWDNYKK